MQSFIHKLPRPHCQCRTVCGNDIYKRRKMSAHTIHSHTQERDEDLQLIKQLQGQAGYILTKSDYEYGTSAFYI